MTAEDVKFSFERYHGSLARFDEGSGGRDRDPRSAACPFQAQGAVARFSDLLRDAPPARAGSCRRNTSRRSATTGSRRRRSAPGPTNSSRSTPGIELVFEAFDGYWRKTPSVKRLVFKMIPDEATRLAALKARRGRHRLFDPRRARRGAAAHARAHPEAGGRCRRRSVSTSPISGTRNRPGMTSGCGRRPAWRSTARASTRR